MPRDPRGPPPSHRLNAGGDGAEDTGSAGPADQRSPRAWHQRLRAVVVEDEFIIMMQIESLLSAAGIEVVGTAVDADEALRVAERERPDFVTMDINLPRGGDGVVTAQRIRERFGIPSVFISAYADAQTRERAEEAAPLGWIAKPVSQPQLDRMLEVVRAELGRG